jgi:hypothetical protein
MKAVYIGYLAGDRSVTIEAVGKPGQNRNVVAYSGQTNNIIMLLFTVCKKIGHDRLFNYCVI